MKKRKWLAIAVCIIMLLGMMPTAAFAENTGSAETPGIPAKEAAIGETQYGTFAEAVVNAEAGETVTLLKDVTLTSTVRINKSITIDGDGNSIATDGSIATMLQIAGESEIDGLTIKNCTFEIPETNSTTWAAIYVQNNVKGLTIENNTFNIKGFAGSSFQCIGLAYDSQRHTEDISIKGNTVTDTHTGRGDAYFLIGGPGEGNRDYSIVNLSITDNFLKGDANSKQLVGASLANVKDLTMTGNEFLYCKAGLYLLTAKGQSAKANVLKDVLTGNDDRGTSEYVLGLAGQAPLDENSTPITLYDVNDERVGLADATENVLSKIGFNAGEGQFAYDTEHNRPITDLTIVAFDNKTITLPGAPTREGYKFTGWKAEVKEGAPVSLDKSTTEYLVTSSMKFVAQWKTEESGTTTGGSHHPSTSASPLTIKKIVNGLDKIPADYVVTVDITGTNGTKKTVTLKADEEIKVDLPYGGTYTLTETAAAVDGYTLSEQKFSENNFALNSYLGKTVTITNTYSKNAEKPAVDTDKPNKPDKPDKPTKPAKANDNPNEVPKTGDNLPISLAVYGIIAAGVLFGIRKAAKHTAK